jgi:hypothetical protein
MDGIRSRAIKLLGSHTVKQIEEDAERILEKAIEEGMNGRATSQELVEAVDDRVSDTCQRGGGGGLGIDILEKLIPFVLSVLYAHSGHVAPNAVPKEVKTQTVTLIKYIVTILFIAGIQKAISACSKKKNSPDVRAELASIKNVLASLKKRSARTARRRFTIGTRRVSRSASRSASPRQRSARSGSPRSPHPYTNVD